MANYFPYFLQVDYVRSGMNLMDLALPNGGVARLGRDAKATATYQGDGSVLVAFHSNAYKGEDVVSVDVTFALRPGETVKKNYFELSSGPDKARLKEATFSLLPLEKGEDQYCRLYREEGENELDEYRNQEPRNAKVPDQPLGSPDPDLLAERLKGE